MKSKKAIKRLKKAQLLLTSVVKQYADSSSAMYDLLSAADGINRAKTLIEADDASTQKGNTSEPRRASPARKATSKQSMDGKKRADGKKPADGKPDSTAAPKKRASSKPKP